MPTQRRGSVPGGMMLISVNHWTPVGVLVA